MGQDLFFEAMTTTLLHVKPKPQPKARVNYFSESQFLQILALAGESNNRQWRLGFVDRVLGMPRRDVSRLEREDGEWYDLGYEDGGGFAAPDIYINDKRIPFKPRRFKKRSI